MSKYKLVIVGGGFGGVKAALTLARSHNFDVTLIHDHPDFRYYPTLYETATGKRRSISSIPLTQIFKDIPINLVEDSAESIDRHKHSVITKSGNKYHYDGLVLALGVKTNFFHIEGLEEFAYGIKTIEDAEKLKAHLHEQIIADNKPDLNYVVVGGGPTGIELAGVLPSYIKEILSNHDLPARRVHVDLVEAAPRLLPRSPKVLSRKVAQHLRKNGVKIYTNSAVQAETVDSLMVNNKPIHSHTVIWTAGMANHPFFVEQKFNLNPRGKVVVDEYLQAEPGIFVIGDNADTPYSGLAQTAVYDGKYLGENIKRLVNGEKLKVYKPKRPIYVFAAGSDWAAVQWGSFEFYGRLGSILRRLADFVGFHDYEPFKIAAEKVIEEYESENSCIVCANTANS